MIDPELKSEFDKLNVNLTAIEKKKGPGIWRSFFNGMFGALGYVAGLAVVIVVLGWVLQRTGLIKPFQEQVKTFTDLIDSAKKLIPASGSSSSSTNSSNQPGNNQVNVNTRGDTTVTLPDGRQVKINLPAGY